jgi:CheY-like chemotaxis protein
MDGVQLTQFRVGSVYDFGADLACVFLAEGWAEPIEDDGFPPVRPPPVDIPRVEKVVLVVDDDPDARELVTTMLTAGGYHVLLAEHGRNALRRLRERCPDLIILDLQMPVMDGWQFRRRQRRLKPRRLARVPVLLVTGLADAAAQVAPLRAVGVLQKPFAPNDLLTAVSAALGLAA